MKSIKKIAFFLFISTSSFGLDIGSQLTIQILDVTQSKRTIRINRGDDDGLSVGEHAKFYLTQSIVARAVCQRVTPRDSIWSVYRIIHPDLLSRNELMNLKITEESKITDRKVLNVAGDTGVSIRLDQSANGDYVAYSDLVKDDRKSFNLFREPEVPGRSAGPKQRTQKFIDDVVYASDISKKRFELWTLLGFHFYSSSVDTGGAQDFEATELFNQFMGGAEYYVWSRFSVQLMAQYLQESLLSYDGGITDSVLLEYGGALNFYLTKPHRSHKPIFYLSGGMMVGSVTDAFAGGATLPTNNQGTQEVVGSARSFFGGLGFKYFLKSGFGMRMLLDVQSRQDIFVVSANNGPETDWIRRKLGPRLMLGLSYRF